MKSTALPIMLATTFLLACGKTEEAVAPPPVPKATQQAEQAPVTPGEPAVAVVETDSTTQPAQSLATPAESPKSVAGSAAPKVPAVAAASPSAASAKSDLTHGQQIYRQACAFCHDRGVAGAPKSGDTVAWSPRLAQGMDALYASALRGKNAMPAKGGNPALADADVKAAVDYLAAQSS
jgi:cytochrome c5